MEQQTAIQTVQHLMNDFATHTGLVDSAPVRRYLWTDAFAVCNYLELHRQTQEAHWLDLGVRLVDQVHHVLGHHRADSSHSGWISGLSEEEGELHPTRGGLRIGKRLNERKAHEAPDEQLEWDRDGQYYHYLTKWMHALCRVGRVTGDTRFVLWAVELAQAAHRAFCYQPPHGGGKRLYWKTSIDLSHPQVPSMGQHDPLDGLVAYSEIHATAQALSVDATGMLAEEISDLASIAAGREWATEDPLGIGGLLCDASHLVQLMKQRDFQHPRILARVVDAALMGLEALSGGEALGFPASYRLAFRELGLSIGLKGTDQMLAWVEEQPELFEEHGAPRGRVAALTRYRPLAEKIERFWLDRANQASASWNEHREINMVMLATSLAPEAFLLL